MSIKAKDMQVFEILEEISKIKNDELKIEILKEKYSDHIPLLRILKMNFCESIISMLPEGVPPFNREKIDGPSKSSLWMYVKHFPAFVRSGQSLKMKPLQIERIFIEMLEAIDVAEADIVCLAKDKGISEKYDIPVEVVQRAFPQLQITNTKSALTPKKSNAEKAAELTEVAEHKKEQAKKLNEEAKALLAEAKELTKAGE